MPHPNSWDLTGVDALNSVVTRLFEPSLRHTFAKLQRPESLKPDWATAISANGGDNSHLD